MSDRTPAEDRAARYDTVGATIRAMLEDESDWIAAMATTACELHHTFDHYNWTGFYRAVSDGLVIGPYQGTHGCLRIDFERGVCGAAARTRTTQLVDDVHEFPDHIACSATTRSEIVVPVISPDDRLLAVLDVDSDDLGAFDEVDQRHLEELCGWLGTRYGEAR